MDFRSLYTTRDGRISRQQWWIGSLILGVIYVVIALLILPLIGLGGVNMAAITAAGTDQAAVSAAIVGSMQVSGWGSLVVFLIFAYPFYCLAVKRRHDKNNNGMDVIGYFALTVIVLLAQAFGLAFSVTDIGGIAMPAPTMLFTVLGFIGLVYAVYMLVVLGFLKGTTGENTYGPDPLGAA